MAHATHPRPTTADLTYEAFFAAALGGTVIAVFFLAVDTLAGRPLYTPSLLGSVLYRGADPASVTGVDLGAAAAMTLLHLLAFGAFGVLATLIVRLLERLTGGSYVVPALALFVVLEGGALAAGSLFLPGVLDVVGGGRVLLANALTAAAMAYFLRQAHCSAEVESAAGRGAGREPDDAEVVAAG